MSRRVILIVLDSFGVGQMPDSADFGDFDVNTLRSCSKSPFFNMPNMKKMGLFNTQCGSINPVKKAGHRK